MCIVCVCASQFVFAYICATRWRPHRTSEHTRCSSTETPQTYSQTRLYMCIRFTHGISIYRRQTKVTSHIRTRCTTSCCCASFSARPHTPAYCLHARTRYSSPVPERVRRQQHTDIIGPCAFTPVIFNWSDACTLIGCACEAKWGQGEVTQRLWRDVHARTR